MQVHASGWPKETHVDRKFKTCVDFHMIGFSDLIDLWVIKIKKPMILCARTTLRSREQSTKCRSPSENMWKVCLFYSQNNKIVWLSNMADSWCAKVCGLFYLIVLCGCWLAGQTKSDHVVVLTCESVWPELKSLEILMEVVEKIGVCNQRQIRHVFDVRERYAMMWRQGDLFCLFSFSSKAIDSERIRLDANPTKQNIPSFWLTDRTKELMENPGNPCRISMKRARIMWVASQ